MLFILFSIWLSDYLSERHEKENTERMTMELRAEITTRIKDYLQQYIHTPWLANQNALNAFEHQWLDARDPAELVNYFCLQMDLYPTLNAIGFGFVTGQQILVRKHADGTKRVIASPDIAKQMFSLDCQAFVEIETQTDVRQQNWYQIAMQQEHNAWSPFYAAAETPANQHSEIRMALSRVVMDNNRQRQGVLRAELALSELNEMLSELDADRSGMTFLIDEEGFLVASSRQNTAFIRQSRTSAGLMPGSSISHLQRVAALDSDEHLLSHATKHLFGNLGGDLKELEFCHKTDFMLGDERIFIQVTPFQEPLGLQWLIVVVLKEADFIQYKHNYFELSSWLLIAGLLLLLLLGWMLTRIIIQPITVLSETTSRISHVQWGQYFPDSRISEVQQLSSAFRRMTRQLQEIFYTLEQRVTERTHALKQSMLALEESQSALQKSEARFRAALKYSKIAVFCHDYDLRYQWLYNAPPVLAQAFGKTDDELLPAKAAMQLTSIKQRVLTTHLSARQEIPLSVNEQTRFYDWIVEPTYEDKRNDGKQAVSGLICVAIDITEHKQATTELFEHREHLEQLVHQRTAELQTLNYRLQGEITERKRIEALERQYMEKLAHTSRLSVMGEMATQIAHQLNQPLTAIATYSIACKHLVKQIPLPGNDDKQEKVQVYEVLDKINSEAQRAGEIIRHLRSLSQGSKLHKAKLHINVLVDEAVNLISVEAQWHEVRLALRLAEKLPLILADKILLEQVLLNVAHNAIEAMDAIPKSSRLLTIGTQLTNDNQLLITIADTGPGLSKEAIEQAFTSFFTTKKHGVGLGLSIGLSIAKAHEGQLWAKPNAQGGTTFYFSLPVKPVDNELSDE
ncbi:ATP-binding protein [Candidatus Venteria ishoeyi]|nr:ATP-binding protein [Candidatus Venteria ishoeyi]